MSSWTTLPRSNGTISEIGDRAGTAESLMALAQILSFQVDQDSAYRLYHESFSLLQEIQDKEFIPSCLEGLAAVKAEQGELRWAAQIWETAEALREAIGTPIAPIYFASYQHAVTNARTRLGKVTFDEFLSQGRTKTPEQTLANQAM